MLLQLDEQIGKSEQYRGKISRKKLYILIPRNGYIFPTIPEADSRVTVAEKLRFTINRAGTPRTYTLTVHRIQFASETEPCYLVLEYCTTLMTLYEMNTEAGLSREQRDEQVLFLILLNSFVKYSSPWQGWKSFNIIPKHFNWLKSYLVWNMGLHNPRGKHK